MVWRDRKQVDTALMLALLDLNQRLTALEQPTSDEVDERQMTLDHINSEVMSVSADLTTAIRQLRLVFDEFRELKNSLSSQTYYLQGIERLVNRLSIKVEAVTQRQATAEQLLDAIRIYAAERTVRDEQAAQQDGTEDGSNV